VPDVAVARNDPSANTWQLSSITLVIDDAFNTGFGFTVTTSVALAVHKKLLVITTV
jgi:hypothetical protein